MAPNQLKPDIRHGRQRPSGHRRRFERIIEREPAIGQSARAATRERFQRRAVPGPVRIPKHLFPSLSAGNVPRREVPLSPPEHPDLEAVQQRGCPIEYQVNRKRKRSQEASPPPVQDGYTANAVPTSPGTYTAGDRGIPGAADRRQGNRHILYWIQKSRWPKENSDQETSMALPLSRKKSAASLRGDPSYAAPAPKDEGKSAPCESPAYEGLLNDQGSYLDDCGEGPSNESKVAYKDLLEKAQTIPEHSLFEDAVFMRICARLRTRNEGRVSDDIGRLVAPSAETLIAYGAARLEPLLVGIKERWNECIPVTSSSPVPDFYVGFKRNVFTTKQLETLEPYTGNVLAATKHRSCFLATWRIFFPFFTCEAKCGAGGLDIADRQNAHSMTLAVRGVVELFRLVKREKEVDRKILAFSISYDDESIRIYGHYAVVHGDQTTFHRHPIRNFSFTDRQGKERWTAYKFTKNVYEIFMPGHLQAIRKAIDEIPAHQRPKASLGGSATSVASADDSQMSGVQASGSQGRGTDGAGSRDTRVFKKPRIPTPATPVEGVDQETRNKQEGEAEIERLNGLLARQQETMDRQQEAMDQQQKAMDRLSQQITLLLQQQQERTL